MNKDFGTNSELAAAIHHAGALLITAGAGMGVDSGLPDFRGNSGFWKAYPPMARLGISFVEMANPYWFQHKPQLAWGFYGHRLNLYRQTKPHAGFAQLLEIGSSLPGQYFVFTSNVDGHFQQAGFSDERVVECHGSIHHLQCTRPCSNAIWEDRQIKVEVDENSFEARPPLPECPNCGVLARPNILMFGDWGWLSTRSAEQGQRLENWLIKIRELQLPLLIIEIGAGTAVPTVRYESENRTAQTHGTMIRINPRDYQVPDGHFPIPTTACEGIEKIYNIWREK